MLALVVLAPLLVSDVPSPRAHGGWVADVADVIDAPVEARLDATIDGFHGKSGVEIAVVTVGDVVGEPHAWGTDLFNAWGIGKAGSDNGVLLLLVMDRRSVELVTGDGIRAALSDDWLQQLQGDAMVPAFKRGDYGGGVEAAVVGIIEHLQTTGESGAERTTPSTPPSPATAGTRTPDAPRRGNRPWLPLGVGGGVLGLGTAAYLFRRRRQRICAACHVGMLKLDEIADDAHLDDGQRKEEKLGSVDYEVRVCPGCQKTRTFTHTRLFSRYRRCDQCDKRTARSRSETLVAATYDHGGQIRITTHCEHCGHSAQRIRHTSQRTRPSTTSSSSSSRSSYSSPSSSSRSSSSSSSSRSSFGGGRASGGGASSKW
jgi:uncharacterized protein